MMKELRLFNPWRGIAATALVGAAAAIAVTFGVMAALILRDKKKLLQRCQTAPDATRPGPFCAPPRGTTQ